MNIPSTRSKIISAMALFFLAEALVALGIAAFFLLLPDSSSQLVVLFERLNLPAALSNLLAVPPLLTAALAGLIFRGLWQLEAWARLAAIVFLFLLMLTAIVIISFLYSFHLLSPGNLVASFLLLFGSLLGFIYLIRTSFLIERADMTDVVPVEPVVPLPVAPVAPAGPITAEPPGWVPPPPPPSAPLPAMQQPPDSTPTRTAPAPAPPTQQLLAAPTQRLPSETPIAWLIVRTGPEMGERIPILPGKSLTLGRDPTRADALLSDPTVSSTHAQIRHEQGRLILYDLNSTNGTYVHEQMVQDHVLTDGDEIRLGTTVLFFTTTS